MMRARKTKRKTPFSVIDIETDKEGNLLALASYDGKFIKRFYSWDDYIEFLYNFNDKKEYCNIFAHYGGGFDYVHMLEASLWELKHVNIITGGSEIILIKLMDFENVVTFADSIKVLMGGLKKIGETFGIEDKKKEIDITKIGEIFKENPAEFWEYLEGDVIALYQIMKKFMKLLEIESFPLTAASLALQIFKERFLPPGVNLFKPSFKPESNIDSFISESYAGGRVECFQPGAHKNIKSYDVNSLYPSVMLNAEIPDCAPVHTNIFTADFIGFYAIEFTQNNKNLPPVLWMKTKEKGLQFVYKGEGVYCSHEINKLIEVGGNIKVHAGIYYPRTAKIFFGYVTELYRMRLVDKKGAMGEICKILLNSLYGKFAQKEQSTTLQKLPALLLKEMLDKGEDVTAYDEEKELYTVGEEREIKHRLIHVASIITSLARIELYKYLEMYANDLIYCDTDSIHITTTMDKKLLGKELGLMKPEEEGNGVYIGRKMYAISNKLKFKGIKTKDKLAEKIAQILTPMDLEKIWSGEVREFSYHTFPKLKGVLKGEKAAKIKLVTKNLKPGKHLSNFVPNKQKSKNNKK